MIRFLLCILFFVFFASSSSHATELSTSSFEKKEIDITLLSKEIQKIEKEITQKSPSKNESILIVKKLNEFYNNAQTKRNIEQSKLEELQKKITALGTLAEGDKESKEIANQRAVFTKEIENIKTQISKTDLALTQIDALNNKVASLRAKGLFETLIVKRNSILNIKEFGLTLVSFATFLYHLLQYPIHWYQEQPVEIQHFSPWSCHTYQYICAKKIGL